MVITQRKDFIKHQELFLKISKEMSKLYKSFGMQRNFFFKTFIRQSSDVFFIFFCYILLLYLSLTTEPRPNQLDIHNKNVLSISFNHLRE